jgi:hypothetical protein
MGARRLLKCQDFEVRVFAAGGSNSFVTLLDLAADRKNRGAEESSH